MSVLKAKKNNGAWEEIHSVKAMTQSTNDFTQDATATANDIAQGVTAYVKGQKITGTVMQIDGTIDAPERTPYYSTIDGGQINMNVDLSGLRFISGNNFKLDVSAKASEFGDAATSDVLSGKTFTSVNGLKLTGTYVPTTTTVNLQTKTVSPTTKQQIIKPDRGYTGLSQVTVNAMASGDLGTPSISVAANGVITATANVSAGGYLAAGTTKNNTLTLSSSYDSDFVASNIRSGKTIFGVTGTYTGTSGVTLPSLTTPASAANILSGYEAINASGAKITGTMTNRGTVNLVINNIDDTLGVNEGYHSGFGAAYISSTERSKIIPGNIKSGITILGVSGTYTGSGSSLPAGISCIASGIYSASSDVTWGTITHDLGVVPNFIVWEAIDDYSVSPGTSCAISGVSWIMPIISGTGGSSYTYAYAIKGYNSSSTLTGTHSAGGDHYATTTTARLMASSNYKLLKGKQYRWVCGVMDV